MFQGVGPEPFDEQAFSGAYLFAQRRRTKRSLKDVLMDQKLVAGVGNIYANEILFVAGIRPRRRLARLSSADCERVVAATREILAAAIEHLDQRFIPYLVIDLHPTRNPFVRRIRK